MTVKRLILIKLYQFFDSCVMAFCLGLSVTYTLFPLESPLSITKLFLLKIEIKQVIFLLIILTGFRFIFFALGLYHSKRLSGRKREIFDVLLATTLATLYLFLWEMLFGLGTYPPMSCILFWVSSSAIVVLSRCILRLALNLARLHGRNLRHMLVVGTNPRALRFAREIMNKQELGYILTGFVEDSSYPTNNDNVVCDFERFPAFISQNVVDEVAIFLPVKSFYEQIIVITGICLTQGIIVRQASSFSNLRNAHLDSVDFAGEHLFSAYTGAIWGGRASLKRLLDIVVSTILLIVFAPVLLAAGVAIALTSGGPIFFVQERIGLNKRRFKLYKFRTMVKDAEKQRAELEKHNEMGGPVFKLTNDPRVIPIGRFLRRFSIDELPQLVNIIKGDMSLVGPRPLPVMDYEGFAHDWHRRRFSVKPGITCLWQVNGRSNIPFERWMELDLQYIDHWSLWLDLKIMMKTIPSVLKAKGAV